MDSTRFGEQPGVSQGLAAAQPTAAEGAPNVEGESWILFVDDERSVRRVGERALVGAGHQVLLAEDGFAALELFERYGSRISLVVLDLTMPRMSGAETLSALRAIDPRVRVVLSSGYSTEEATRCLGEQRPTCFIQKPYRVAQLLETVEAILAQPGTEQDTHQSHS